MKFGGPEECSKVLSPVPMSFTSAAISLILVLVTVPGNFLICMVIIKDPNKNLRTPFNFLIFNVAAADLLVGAVDLPLSIAFHVCEGLRVFHPQLIKTLHMSVFVTCTASVLGICTLTFDRYIAIKSPLKYRTKMSSSRVKRITTALWIVSILITVIYLKVDYILYTFFYVNLILLFTVLVLAVVHYRISRILNEARFEKRNLDLGTINTQKTVERNSRVTKAFLVLLVIFFLCNLPTFVFSYVLNFCQICDCVTVHILRDFGFLTLMLGSAINPFFYGLRLPHFKSSLKKLCRSIRCAQQTSKSINMDETLDSGFPSGNEAGIVNKGATYVNNQIVLSEFSCRVRNFLPKYGSYSFGNPKTERSLEAVTLERCTYF